MIYLSGVNTGALISNSNYAGGAGNNIQQKNSLAQENSTDKVTISAAGKAASELDVEKYALPKWINSYVAPLNDLSSALARKPGSEWSDQREALKTELKQYGEYYSSALQAAMKAVGTTSGPSYNAMVASDPSVADRAQNVFKETLMSMPGVELLMSRLDVPASKSG